MCVVVVEHSLVAASRIGHNDTQYTNDKDTIEGSDKNNETNILVERDKRNISFSQSASEGISKQETLILQVI